MSNLNPLLLISNTQDVKPQSKSYTSTDSGFNDIFENINKSMQKEQPEVRKEEFNSSVPKKESSEETSSVQDSKVSDTSVHEGQESKVEDKKPQEDKNEEVKEDNQQKGSDEKTSREDEADGSEKGLVEKAVEVVKNVENATSELISKIGDKLSGPKTEQAQVKDAKAASKAVEDIDVRIQQAKVMPENQKAVQNIKADDSATLNAKAPVIQVANNVKADVKLPEENKVKEALEQPRISQKILDETNAKVVNVETTTSSDNMLKNNAQEQSVKLSIEGLNHNQAHVNNQNPISVEKGVDSILVYINIKTTVLGLCSVKSCMMCKICNMV